MAHRSGCGMAFDNFGKYPRVKQIPSGWACNTCQLLHSCVTTTNERRGGAGIIVHTTGGLSEISASQRVGRGVIPCVEKEQRGGRFEVPQSSAKVRRPLSR
jgi:hypothetical protein